MCHFLKTFSSHGFQIHRSGESNQAFIRANIRSRFLAPDVLLACSQCQYKPATTFFVERFTNQAAGNLTCVFFSSRKESDIWTTKREWHTERLSLRDHDVRATLTR